MVSTAEQVVVTHDGLVKTRVLTGGTGSPVVVLHGMEGLQWSDFLDGLSNDYTVYAVEHVGSGDSSGLEHLHDFWDLAVHYEELFDELGLQSAALVGHSFGGMVAAEVAAHLRRRVDKLVLLSPLGLWRDDVPVAEIDAIDRSRRAEVLLANPTVPLPRLLCPEVDDQEGLFNADLTAASINQFTWPIAEKGLERRLYRVTAPTLLVWGTQDRIVDPSYAELFAAKLSDARTQIIPDVGHLLHLEDPPTVLSAVAPFLKE